MTIKNSKMNAKTGHDVGFGVKMYVDLVDPHTWDLVLGNDDEKNIKKIFLDHIIEGSTVIDVGAHLGEYSLIAAKKVGSTGKIIAIEPFREAVVNIKKNFLLNNFNNYIILEVAVGNKLKKQILYENSIRAGAYLDPILEKNQLFNTKEIEVETIDNIILSRKIKKIDMLKIDVDGYEYEVLFGCQESFKQNKINNILCEIHPEHLKKKGVNEEMIYSLLKKNGYVIKHLGNTRNITKEILARKIIN